MIEMIKALRRLDPRVPVFKLANPHSYRGYHDQLAFEIDSSQTMEAGILLDVCEKLQGSTLQGYKGGVYKITDNTPVWVAEYDNTGRPLEAIQEDGKIILGEDD